MTKLLAKAVRVVTIPPVMICALLLILYFARRSLFSSAGQLLWALLFLMVVPILAYPVSYLVPKWREKGREGQRSLAFLFSFAGYTGGAIYAFAAGVGDGLLLIFLTYFLSVLGLILLQKGFRQRASGHACSMTGPLILLSYFIGWWCVPPCAVVFAIIIWASLALKRHTPKELILGSLTAGIAFLAGLLLVYLL